MTRHASPDRCQMFVLLLLLDLASQPHAAAPFSWFYLLSPQEVLSLHGLP